MRIALVLLALVSALAACQSSDVSRSLGAECTLDSDCAEKCLSGGNWPDGFCTTVCDNDTSCSTDARCIEESGGVCAFACTADENCQFLGTTFTCQAFDSHGGGTKVMVCRGG